MSFVAPSTLSRSSATRLACSSSKATAGRRGAVARHPTRTPGGHHGRRPLLRRLQRQIDALAQARSRAGSACTPTPPARPTGPCCIRSRRNGNCPGASPSAGTLPASCRPGRRLRADSALSRRRGLRASCRRSENRTDAGENPGEWAITDESPGGFGLRYPAARARSGWLTSVRCVLASVPCASLRGAPGGQPRRARIRHRRRGARRARRESTTLNLPAETIGEPRTSVDVILLPRVPALARQAAILAPGRGAGEFRAPGSGMAANGASSPPTRWSISTPASSFPCACCGTRHPAEQAQRGRPACRTAARSAGTWTPPWCGEKCRADCWRCDDHGAIIPLGTQPQGPRINAPPRHPATQPEVPVFAPVVLLLCVLAVSTPGALRLATGVPVWLEATRALGLASLVLWALSLVLMLRLRSLEEALGGLDRLYHLHHLCGGLAYLALLAHPLPLFLASAPATGCRLPAGPWRRAGWQCWR